jgi:hypothetical protein
MLTDGDDADAHSGASSVSMVAPGETRVTTQ